MDSIGGVIESQLGMSALVLGARSHDRYYVIIILRMINIYNGGLSDIRSTHMDRLQSGLLGTWSLFTDRHTAMFALKLTKVERDEDGGSNKVLVPLRWRHWNAGMV